MGSLQYHQELQKGLDSITRISALKNNLLVNVQHLEERLVQLRAEEVRIQKLQGSQERTESEHQQTLAMLQRDIQGAKGQLDAVLATIQELELERALELNELSASHNSIQEFKRLKALHREEMNLYARLKGQKLDEYNKTKSDLDGIQASILASQDKLSAINSKIATEKLTQKQREQELDNKESQLVVRTMHLDKYEKRLMKYAEKLNIKL